MIPNRTHESAERIDRLHDSLKQSLFATSMQLGIASIQLQHNTEAAHISLGEARRLINQMQQELLAYQRIHSQQSAPRNDGIPVTVQDERTGI